MKRVKASIEDVDILKVQVETLPNNFGKKLGNLYIFVQENQQLYRNENLKNELYSKRFNILIHGQKEHNSHVWEAKERTKNIVHEFFQNALCIKNSETIKFADIHRLPLPLLRNSKKIQGPTITK